MNVTCATPMFHDPSGRMVVMTCDLLIGFDTELDEVEREVILAAAAPGQILDRNWSRMPGVYRTRSSTRNGLMVLNAANELASLDQTRFAEPDMIFAAEPGSTPNDELFSSQWALHNLGQSGECNFEGIVGVDIRALNGWQATTGDPSIIVVIIDNGVQMDHPDLIVDFGADFTPQSGDGGPIEPCDNHGTPVAGIIGSTMNNLIGTAGVAPDVRIASARISIPGPTFCTPWTVKSSWVINALDWSQSIGARVTNTSWRFLDSSAMSEKYTQTRNAGLIHFAAAGNTGEKPISFPSSLDSVIAVTAIDASGALASFSSYGPGVALTAPGVGVIAADRTGADGYASGDHTCFGGTSAASPYCAGVAALVLSVAPWLTVDQVEDLMIAHAIDMGTPGYNTFFGWGLVNAEAALHTQPHGDLNGDGVVDASDLLILLAAWGPCPQNDLCPADLNGDGNVNVSDLLTLLANWSN